MFQFLANLLYQLLITRFYWLVQCISHTFSRRKEKIFKAFHCSSCEYCVTFVQQIDLFSFSNGWPLPNFLESSTEWINLSGTFVWWRENKRAGVAFALLHWFHTIACLSKHLPLLQFTKFTAQERNLAEMEMIKSIVKRKEEVMRIANNGKSVRTILQNQPPVQRTLSSLKDVSRSN